MKNHHSVKKTAFKLNKKLLSHLLSGVKAHVLDFL